MAASTDKTNKPLIPRGVDDRPVDKYNRAELYSGKALDFDGVNDQIIVNGVNNIFDYGNSYTMAGYFKIVDSGSGGLMGNSNGNSFANLLGFVYKSGEDSNFYPDGSSSNYITIYSGNTTDFVYMVCTSDGTTAKAYLNGQLVGSTSVSSYTNTSSRFNVGSSYSANFGEHEAAGVRVFNTALTAAQVADLYNNPEKVVPTGVDNTALKLWLPMMEGAGTTAYDGSGNSNHGTISGATYVNGVGAPVAQTAVIDWNKGQNIFTYSEDFTQWGNARTTDTANATTAPDGSNNAIKLEQQSGQTSAGSIYLAISLSGSNDYQMSVFAKAVEKDFVVLYDGNANRTYFNVSTGVVGTNNSGGTATIEAFANDWYKCTITYTQPSTGTVAAFYLADTDNNTTVTDSGGIYLWGPSIALEGKNNSYLPTYGTIQNSDVLLPQGLTSGRDITGVNLFENVRKQGALNLDGNSWALVHDNASLDITNAISVECWYYFNNLTNAHLIGKRALSGNWVRIYRPANGKIRLERSAGAALDATGLIDGNWIHIVGTIDESDNAKIYINGVEENTESNFAPWGWDTNVPVSIGAWIYTNTLIKAAGSESKKPIAQPRVYNRALTASEVLNNYNTTKNLYI